MQNSALKAWLDSSYLSGSNQSWIEQLYEDFLTDPDSVDANWRSTFQQLPGTGVKPDQLHSKTRDYFRRWRRCLHVTLLRFPTLTPM
jgi:2-oxoglutarate dehydrogenase E1 component